MNPEAGGERADVRSGGAEPGPPLLGRPTMTDVAAAAAVGLKTVSGWSTPSLTPETAARVRAPIEQLGSRRNDVARAFRRGQRFRMLGLVIEDVKLEPAFAVLVAVVGSGRLATEAGELELSRGDTVLVPYAAGAGEVTGGVEAIRCLQPASGVRP